MMKLCKPCWDNIKRDPGVYSIMFSIIGVLYQNELQVLFKPLLQAAWTYNQRSSPKLARRFVSGSQGESF